jgi:predicted RNA-binding protein associated with RNAse of E/G family
MLNRKYADFRHAPRLDAGLVRYDPRTPPQAVARLGPACVRKTKGGLVLAEPGYTWALFLFPGAWYALTAIFDRDGHPVADHVDVATPPEEHEGMLSFVDLKLDLLIPAAGEDRWVDREDYEGEIRAGRVPAAWQAAVDGTVALLTRERAAGRFPPPEVRAFRPPP